MSGKEQENFISSRLDYLILILLKKILFISWICIIKRNSDFLLEIISHDNFINNIPLFIVWKRGEKNERSNFLMFMFAGILVIGFSRGVFGVLNE